MTGSRIALVLAAGVAAGATIAGVGVVATSAARHPTSRVAAASGSGDSVEMQALDQLAGLQATRTRSSQPSTSNAPNGGPHLMGPMGRGPLWRGLMGGGLMGGGPVGGAVLHGTVTVQTPDGKTVDVEVQRGTVSAVGGGHLTVRSSDGFSTTWSTGGDTRYLAPGLRWRLGGTKPGSSAAPSTAPSGSAPAKGALVLVLGRVQGSSSPTARLVLTVPDLSKLRQTAPRWMGPGNRHGWGGPNGEAPYASPKASPAKTA
ncbi:MAG TPA: hypothetical protein VMI11_03650 [Actinomycetes bacterium]|nr:hypothetical protein [Actinomycetes bacterium]